MSRVLWHGIGPGHATGYGQMTAETTRRLRDLGHEVVIAVMGERDGPRAALRHPGHAGIVTTGRWEGMRAIGPSSEGEFRLPSRGEIWDAFGGHDPDLILVLKDAWVLTPGDYRDYNTAVWLVFDTEPLGIPDRGFLAASGARPVCASLAGRRMVKDAGFDPLYVPCGIDTSAWSPADRGEVRDYLGLPRDAFIAGICAANIGPRKAWGEQLSAFAAFRRRHPGALLLIHAARRHAEGIDLEDLAGHLGIRDAVLFGEHTAMDDPQMVNWFRSLDVLLNATYGEGFGLPVIQAQACGVPVIGTKCSAISEKIPNGTGWLVSGQRWWNPHHRAWWTIPDVRGITAALGKAAAGKHARPEIIREHAMTYDADYVAKAHWAPVLAELAGGGRLCRAPGRAAGTSAGSRSPPRRTPTRPPATRTRCSTGRRTNRPT